MIQFDGRAYFSNGWGGEKPPSVGEAFETRRRNGTHLWGQCVDLDRLHPGKLT